MVFLMLLFGICQVWLGESYVVDEIAGLNHLSIHILQKTVFIVLQVSENQDDITCTQSLHCLVLKTSCIIRVSLGSFILFHCESNVVVLQSYLETVLQSKNERFKIQCRKGHIWKTNRNVSIFQIPWKLWQYIDVFTAVASVAE